MVSLNVFTSATIASAAAAAVWLNKYPYDGQALAAANGATVLTGNCKYNVSGVVTGTITTDIASLTAVFDKIFVNCTAGGTAGTGKLTSEQLYTLYSKLKAASQGTVLKSVTDITVHTTTSIGDSGETWDVNAYAGKWVHLKTGTGSGQIAKILSNDATTLTLHTAVTTDPDTTTDIDIIDTDAEFYLCGNTESTVLAPVLAWLAAYPGNQSMPAIISYLSGTQFFSPVGATVTPGNVTVAAGSLTDSDKTWTAHALIGMYVYIYSATTGANQYRKITENTTTALTLKSNWTVTPTTSASNIYYRVMEDATELFYDAYVEHYITTFMLDPTKASHASKWKKLLDYESRLTDAPTRTPLQDVAMWNEVLTKGKAMYDYHYPPVD